MFIFFRQRDWSGVKRLSKKEKKEEKLMDMNHNTVTAGWRETEGDKWRLDLGWCTHNTEYRGCVVELCTRNLYNFVNQGHPSEFQ